MKAWKPYPGMQTRFLQSTAFETLAGGSRGPGKTDVGVINGAKSKYLNNPRARGLVIRKNSDDLADWLDRARYYYERYGGIVTGKPGIINFPSGYKIRTGHLKDKNAYTKYQGQEYQWMLIEELTQIAQEIHYLKLIASCRSSIPGLDPRVYATTNPGGVGHAWVKRRFIDPSPPNKKFIGPDTGRTRVFFPGTVDDNPAIMENDPDYVKMLDGLKHKDIELYKAWRLGDWDTFAGQFFREFDRRKHVIKPFTPNYTRKDVAFIAGLDWGREAPFSFHASVVVPVVYNERKFLRTVTFREVYGTHKLPREWAEEIAKIVPLDSFRFIQCDNQIFSPNDDGSMSIFEQFCQADERFRLLMKPATKDRIGGWVNMRNWLSLAPDGKPYWLMAENCINLIRTLPELVHDEVIVEDIDTQSEDHAADDQRYQFSGFKWIDAGAGQVSYKQEIPTSARQFIGDIDLNEFIMAN